jgi:TetR/AcrR family transcriptional regulator, cholesterol catabolism regulator
MSNMKLRRAAAAAAAEDSLVYRERRQAILEAAGRVFHLKGYAATKLADVAVESGVDRATLYYYVSSKWDLFRDVVSEAVEQNVVDAEALAKQDAPASEKLSQLIEMLMTSFGRSFPAIYVFVQEDLHKLERSPGESSDDWLAKSQQWKTRYFAAVKRIVAQGIAAEEFSTRLTPGLVANSLIGMLNSSYLWFEPKGKMSAASIGAGIADMVLQGLQPKRSGSKRAK